MKKYVVIKIFGSCEEAVFEGTELECMEYIEENEQDDLDIIPADCY